MRRWIELERAYSPQPTSAGTIRPMTTWTVLVWNMGLGSLPRRNPAKNWHRLSKLMEERSVDVALLSEASVPLPSEFKARYAMRGTKGRDRSRSGEPIPRPWSTAVVSAHKRPEKVDARAVGSHGRRPNIPFKPSRAGSWMAAVVEAPIGRVTCVSLYGLLEELSDASVHRSLSEISPIFTDPAYKNLVLLGGDLNTSTAWPDHARRLRDKTVLKRIEAHGLVDCLKLTRKPGRLTNCTCIFGQECQHTWTRLDPNQKGRRIKTPHQMDYLFASVPLARRLTSSEALSPVEWRDFSDHAPIVATFD